MTARTVHIEAPTREAAAELARNAIVGMRAVRGVRICGELAGECWVVEVEVGVDDGPLAHELEP